MAGSAPEATLADVMADRDAVVAERDALNAANAEKDNHIDGLQAALVVCEQACWKEGQTVEGLSKAIRRAVQEFLNGKNPAQKLAAANEHLTTALRELVGKIEEEKRRGTTSANYSNREIERARDALAGQPAEPANARLLDAANKMLAARRAQIDVREDPGAAHRHIEQFQEAERELEDAIAAAAEQAPAPSVNGELLTVLRAICWRLEAGHTKGATDIARTKARDLIAKYGPTPQPDARAEQARGGGS